MAKALSLWKDWSKGIQRTRKLSTVNIVEAGEMQRLASWQYTMEKDRRC